MHPPGITKGVPSQGNGTPANCTHHSLVEDQDELHAANYFTPQAVACATPSLIGRPTCFRWAFALPAPFVSP
jgi:hypothetical protein